MKDIHGGNIWEASRITGLLPEEVLDFSSSINPLGLPHGAAAAIKKTLKLLPAYPDPSYRALKRALAAHHGISPSNILPGNGSTELIYLVPAVFRPKKALIVEPAFSEYRRALRLHGCAVKTHILRERDGFAMNAGRLIDCIRKGGHDIVFLANPSNPAGSLAKKEAVLEVARASQRLGAILVVDEAFIDFTEEESIKAEASNRLGNTVALRSMTKFFALSGLRLGFMAASRDIIEGFSKAMPPWTINTLAAEGAMEALKDAAYMERSRRWLCRERAFLGDGLGRVEGLSLFPSSANFILVKITAQDKSAAKLCSRLLKRGILIRPLNGFKGLGPEYFRVAIKRRKENSILLSALKQALK
ncbi:MAG: threonine-phosphate decarboxylase [Deltaproteobacteria bacterium]|nr:threonine-phosphate decarboxylase [Deltaproteobacteria bacterium]